MNITTVENEIYEFNVAFFQKYVAATDEFAQLAVSHGLYIPKENYTLVSDFLNKLFSHFKTLDPKFFNPTLKKLYFDTVRLQQLLLSLELETQNPKTVFQNRFLPSSPSFGMLKKEIAKLKNRSLPSLEEKQTLSALVDASETIKKIAYRRFSALFYKDAKYLRHKLLEALNSKTFYFDRLLWIEARKSTVLSQHLKEIGFSTKEYILHSDDFLKTYTKNKNYFQNCLRIYK